MREAEGERRWEGRVYFSFEIEIAVQVGVVVLGYACIAEFEDHLAKKNTAGIHIGHGDDVF